MKRLGRLGRRLSFAALAFCSACHAESTPVARGEVAVAPFAENVGGGAALPDVAGKLAQRLGTLGVGPVVPPRELGAALSRSPGPGERAALRERTGARTLVLGSATRVGAQISLDARLVELETGAELGLPLIEQASGDADLPRALDTLAARIVTRLAEPAPVHASGAAKAPKKRGRKPGEPREPVEIQADQLDALAVTGGRRLTFAGHVRAEQGDVKVACNRLEAFYPTGASQPDKLVASGDIHVDQADRTALCDQAIFYRAEDRIVCTGKPAQLTQACDRVTGDQITFELDTEKLEVEGNSRVEVRPCAETPGTGP